MSAIEAYRKCLEKVKKTNILMHTAFDITRKLDEVEDKIDSITNTAWNIVFKNIPEKILTANLSRKHQTNIRQRHFKEQITFLQANVFENIATDPVRGTISAILEQEKDAIEEIEKEPVFEEIPVMRQITEPYKLEEVALLKVVAFTTDVGAFRLRYVFNNKVEEVDTVSMTGNMIKEQTIRETNRVLKKYIKTMQKTIKKREKFVRRLRERLKPYVVADKIEK